MGTRSVRLDEATEKALEKLTKANGLSISEVLKRGVLAYGSRVEDRPRKPYEIFKSLDLGPGGYARAAAKDSKRAVASVIRRKHRK